MVESLIHMDKAVFRFFNTIIANPLFDWIMPIITNQNIRPVTIIISIFALLFRGGRRGRGASRREAAPARRGSWAAARRVHVRDIAETYNTLSELGEIRHGIS